MINGMMRRVVVWIKSAVAMRDGRLSLRANFSWTFMGRVVYVGCQWGMLTVLAKLGSPEMVGRFSLGLAVTAPIILNTERVMLRAGNAGMRAP